MWLLLHFAALALLLAVVSGVGRATARRLGTRSPVAARVLGIAGASVLVLVLAAFGWLPPSAAGWWALAAGAGLLALRAGRPERPERAGLLAAVAVAALLLPVLLLAATPTVSWDADAYHLSVPRLYLEAGGFRPVPMNVYSNWPLGTEMLYLAALGLGSASLAKLVHSAFGLLVLAVLWRAGTVAGRREGAVLAGLLWLVHPVVLFEYRVAYVELAQAFWLLAAFALLEEARRRPAEARALVLSAGVAAGMLGSTKLTGLLQAPILALVALPGVVRSAGRRSILHFAAPFLVLVLPWPLKAWWATGNPIYPFAPEIFGGVDWSARLGERLERWQASIGPGREPLDFLALPWRVFLSGGAGYARFDGELAAAGVVLFPLGLLGILRLEGEDRGTATRAAAVAGLLFVLWATTSQQMRLLVPALALACLAAGWGAAALVRGTFPAGRAGIAGLGLACLVVFFAENRDVLAAGWRAGSRLATLPVESVRESGVPPLWRELRERLPPDALLLMLQTNGRYFAPTEVLADSFFEASQIADWLEGSRDAREVLGRFRRRGVSHVLLDRRPVGVRWPPALLELLERDELLPRVWESPDGRYRLWAVPAPAPREESP